MRPPVEALPARTALPPGAATANCFSLFNAISWQIVIGAPIVVYANYLHASSTVLGLIGGMLPLMTIFQIPAAGYLPRFGYRRFILTGWGTRIVFIFVLAAVPFLQFLPRSTRLSLVLLALLGFNTVRGITSGAWMPWITELIPHPVRGRFLSRDQAFTQAGCLISLAISAVVLIGAEPRPWQFAFLFFIAALGGGTSLYFVQRMPDVTTPDTLKHSGHRVPWLAMATYPPFLRLVVFNLLFAAATAGLVVFTPTYLQTRANFPESRVLWLSALINAGSLMIALRIGHWVDRVGSRPVLRISLALFALVCGGWWLIAAKLATPSVGLIILLNLLLGSATAIYSIANSRLSMSTIPPMGRNHFFALYTVITSLGLALSPIAWGTLLDSLRGVDRTFLHIHWNQYSIYFAAAGATALPAILGIARLHDAHPDAPPLATGARA